MPLFIHPSSIAKEKIRKSKQISERTYWYPFGSLFLNAVTDPFEKLSPQSRSVVDPSDFYRLPPIPWKYVIHGMYSLYYHSEDRHIRINQPLSVFEMLLAATLATFYPIRFEVLDKLDIRLNRETEKILPFQSYSRYREKQFSHLDGRSSEFRDWQEHWTDRDHLPCTSGFLNDLVVIDPVLSQIKFYNTPDNQPGFYPSSLEPPLAPGLFSRG